MVNILIYEVESNKAAIVTAELSFIHHQNSPRHKNPIGH